MRGEPFGRGPGFVEQAGRGVPGRARGLVDDVAAIGARPRHVLHLVPHGTPLRDRPAGPAGGSGGAGAFGQRAKLAENVAKRVRMWSDVKPFYPDNPKDAAKTAESRGTESILNALILTRYDAPSGKLSEDARLALDNMWAEQLKTGEAAGDGRGCSFTTRRGKAIRSIGGRRWRRSQWEALRPIIVRRPRFAKGWMRCAAISHASGSHRF